MVEKIKKKKRRKILVTGSSGMLGADICGELGERYDIIGLDRRAPARRGASAPDGFIRCDITDKEKTIKAVSGVKPDFVIHAAAWTDVDGCEKNPDKAKRINRGGTGNVASSTSKLDICLLYISTDFVFDGKKNSPYTEEDVPNPINVYGKSKLGGEEEAGAIKKYIILRSAWLYGTNGKNFVDTILEKAKSKKEIKVVDDQVGCPTYTKDLTGAIARLIEISFRGAADKGRRTRDEGRGTRGIYHVSNKGRVSWFDYAKEILKMAGAANVRLIPIKTGELSRPAERPGFSVLDNGKFEASTGLVMRPWQEALREYLHDKSEIRNKSEFISNIEINSNEE